MLSFRSIVPIGRADPLTVELGSLLADDVAVFLSCVSFVVDFVVAEDDDDDDAGGYDVVVL